MKPARTPPWWLLALGKEPPPPEIELAGRPYRLRHVFKHDFFAYTARYDGEERDIVLKIGRKASLLGLPLGWIGRWHAAHESAVFLELQDLSVVPAFTGRWGRHGITHEYVESTQLTRGQPVPDDFFARLREGLAAMHARGLAYVDLEKPENVLLGVDQRPYPFDFQISWRWPYRFGRSWWPVRWIQRVLQDSDLYHVAKLQRRTRPDQMTEAELAASRVRPGHLRIYGVITRPFIHVRRWFLSRLDLAKRSGERGRTQPPPRPDTAPAARPAGQGELPPACEPRSSSS